MRRGGRTRSISLALGANRAIHQINVKENPRLTAFDRSVQGTAARGPETARQAPSGWAAEPMCGICGMVGRADRRLIDSMTETLAHRGPDGDGVEVFGADGGRLPAALGHRRLSIIDPSPRGAQPMAYADGRYWITYNGELYNFRELRAELEADGLRFESDCDTEVMLAMYAEHGEQMLDRLNGIFAFAIWDTERQRALPGARPARREAALLRAAGRRPLLRIRGQGAAAGAARRPSLRHDAVADYLTFLWVPDPGTRCSRASTSSRRALRHASPEAGWRCAVLGRRASRPRRTLGGRVGRAGP